MPGSRLFLLSPASVNGRRGQLLLSSPQIDLARQLRTERGAPLGEVFAFISSLYFRGKLAYARAFAPEAAYVITAGHGLLPLDAMITLEVLREFSAVPISEAEPRFTEPLMRDITRLAGAEGREVVLFGSVASAKYTAPLLGYLGSRLLFPSTFVGRGDMSRGGLMLRAAREAAELDYEPVADAILRGKRPPRLLPPAPRRPDEA